MAPTELLDPTAARIVLAANRGDSINRVANKVRGSYSWIYEWIERLETADVIVDTDNGVRIVDHELRQHYDAMVGALYSRGTVARADAYVIPHFAGMEFAYTEIDAAYVWTHGGYQIARSHDDYPVFVQVHERDIERWEAFFQRYGVETTIGERPDASDVDGAVHYVLFPKDDGFDVAWVDGDPVIPLDDAVEQMTADRAAYEPALEIVATEYDVEVDATHHEASPVED
jgi:hypothetical protein